MKPTYPAVIKEDAEWEIRRIEEVADVNCQEQSPDGLLKTPKVRIKETLEFNPQEALEPEGSYFEEEQIEVRSNLGLSQINPKILFWRVKRGGGLF